MTKLCSTVLAGLIALMFAETVDAQWVQTNGPEGAVVTSLLSDGNNLYAGTENGVMYLSTNQGTSWLRLKPVSSASVLSIVVRGDTIFVANNFGIFRTVNKDSSWTLLNTGIGYLYAATLQFLGNSLFLGTTTGVYRLVSGASSWSSANNGIPANTTVMSFLAKDTLLFAATYGNGVYVTKDSGGSWRPVNTGLSDTVVISLLRSDTSILAGTNSNLFVSPDNGNSWSVVYNPGFGNIKSLAMIGINIFASTYNGVWRIKTNFSVWYQRNLGLPGNSGGNALAVIGTTLFWGGVGGGGGEYSSGIFLSKDYGDSWSQANTGLINASVSSLAQSGSNLYAVSDQNGLAKSTDDGFTWSGINPSTPFTFCRSVAVVDSIVLAGTYSSGIFKSTNSGGDWTMANTGSPLTGFIDPAVLYMARVDKTVFATISPGKLVRTTDLGGTWTKADSGLPSGSRIVSISSSSLDTNVYAAIYNKGIFKSAKTKIVWTSDGSAIGDTTVSSVAVIGTTLLAGTYWKGVYRSTDGGASWNAANSGFPTNWGYFDVRSLSASGASVFAVVSGLLYHSTDMGTSWTKSLLPENVVAQTCLAGGSSLYIGAYSEGVWRRPLSDFGITSVGEERSSPNRFALFQNYPNPFNPTTTIRFDVPEKSRVRLLIFNLLGQQVAELANEIVNTGPFHKVWTAGVASGIYFYRLETISVSDPNKRLVDVKKMVLLK